MTSTFLNVPDEGTILFVDSSAERTLLSPSSGRMVLQRDTKQLWCYDITLGQWELLSDTAITHSHTNKTYLDVINQNLSNISEVTFSKVNATEFRVDTVTFINATEVNLEDNVIVLNSGTTGVPVADAGIEVERGSETNATLTWNETTEQWEAGLVGATEKLLRYSDNLGSAGTTIDGGGEELIVGTNTWVVLPFNATITGWTILADQSGSCVVDVRKTSYANFPAEAGDSITNSTPPTLTSQLKNTSTTLTGWTTSLSKGDILVFNVNSVDTITRVTVVLNLQKL
jgi:hypothetical protein